MSLPPAPNPPAVDDERLSAWLDGELDSPAHAAERATIEARLQADPTAAARVRAWAADADALRAFFGPAAEEPVPDRLQALLATGVVPGASAGPAETAAGEPPRAAANDRWLRVASWAGAGLALGLVLGAAGMAAWQQRDGAAGPAAMARADASGWVQRAALAHSVYVPEPRHPVEVKAQEEHLARWLTRRIDVPVKLFDLRAHGLELMGGRLLPDGAGKSAQLMYQDAQGRRVTVYLRKPERDVDTAFRYERQGELGMFYWIESGGGYALVGALPKEQLLTIAQSIYEQQPPAAPAAAPAVPQQAQPLQPLQPSHPTVKPPSS